MAATDRRLPRPRRSGAAGQETKLPLAPGVKYRRVLLKLSGEALMGSTQNAIDPATLSQIADELVDVQGLGVEIAMVLGGGNIFRGIAASSSGMDRAHADYMGMLATVINSLALQDALESRGAHTRVMTALEMERVAEPYIRRRSIRHLEKGRLVIFAAGTGNPYFTTDTAASLRAMEIGAEIVMKATKVDGVYDKDPNKHKDARMFRRLSYLDVLNRNLGVMDSTAISLCRDNSLPILVFNMTKPGNIRRVLLGEPLGTMVLDERREPRPGDCNLEGNQRGDPMIDDIVKSLQGDLEKGIEAFRRELGKVRTGRANLSILDGVRVDYYGTPTPLNQVASCNVADARLITIKPWERSLIPEIEKSIRAAQLGLNPQSDGELVRLPMPALTQERRQDLVKVVKKMAEEARVALRGARRDANEMIKEALKEGSVTEDDERKGLKTVQETTDKSVLKIDEIVDQKRS